MANAYVLAHRNIVQLDLTPDEAAVVAALVATAAGSPRTSPRKHAAEVIGALRSVGYAWDVGKGKEMYELIPASHNMTYFSDYPAPFVPGYYRRKGLNQVDYFDADPGTGWVRVNVTVASE